MENPKEKTPPMDDGALKCFAGLRRQSRPTQATIFLHYSKYQHNAFHVSPTVRSFPDPKASYPRAHFARKGFPSARLLQGELRDNAGIEPQ